jgi:hypothetical protein
MTRLHGWAPKGQRLVDKIPHRRWKTATFLAALRNDRVDAPCLFDGPITASGSAPKGSMRPRSYDWSCVNSSNTQQKIRSFIA